MTSEQPEVTAEEQGILDGEQAMLADVTRRAEVDYLAARVAHLAVENHRLRARLAEHDPAAGD